MDGLADDNRPLDRHPLSQAEVDDVLGSIRVHLGATGKIRVRVVEPSHVAIERVEVLIRPLEFGPDRPHRVSSDSGTD